MQKLPLIGGSYSSRSVIANAQRCLNLFPEINRKDAPVPVTHYQRPGLTPLATGVRAIGTLTYSGNPADGDTVTLNSVVWTYKNTPTGPTDIQRTGTIGLTNLNAVTAFTASTDPLMTVASYSLVAGTGATVIKIWYNTIGAAGNAYTLAASAATPSAATLLHGVDFAVSPAVGRCIFRASNGSGYCVIGINVYYIDSSWNLIFVGTLGGSATNVCSMVDNGIQILLVDGSPAVAGVGGGWKIDLDDQDFAVMNDTAWTGAFRVDYMDTFIIWNELNSAGAATRNFGSTLSNQITPLDATYVAGKTSWPDAIAGVIVNKRQILLLGDLKSETWYDAGNPLFPFAELQGASIEHGVVAKYSMASADEGVFWLSQTLQGQGYVLKHTGNQTKRISNHALEYQIRLMSQNGGTISDAVGYTYQVDGHLFYVLNFPTGNQTWVWDESVGDPELGWSQRGWVDSSGNFNRDRGLLGAFIGGKNVAIDWQYGFIYEQSMTTYVDKVAGQDYPILYLRTFPHLMSGTDPATGAPVLCEGKVVQHDRFQLDATVGTGPAGQNPIFQLRWSDDRGQSWGNPVQLFAGAKGKFATRPDLRTLGQAMDRVYEVSWNFSGEVALNGAWVDGRVLNQ